MIQSTILGLGDAVRHPARYTRSLLPVFARILRDYECKIILDPFAGTGRIHELRFLIPSLDTHGIEIEEEWARFHSRTRVGDATDLPWGDETFDAIVTSPAYANRMADTYTDHTHRNTYTAALGRPLSENNSGAMQWGVQYRALHVDAWREATRVLKPNGIVILNIKDHIRAGERVHVTYWHKIALTAICGPILEEREVFTPGNRYGQNSNLRVDCESVIVFKKGG